MFPDPHNPIPLSTAPRITTPTTRTARIDLPVHVRYMIRRDIREVLQIERALFCDFAWEEEAFSRCLNRPNCASMTIENYNCDIVSYIIYELYDRRIQLLNFAVDPGYHRKGIGRQVIGRLKEKLNQQRRRKIVAEIRETNLDAQLFFRSMGFLAIEVVKGRYVEDGCDEDAIIFEFHG